jgi:hypothetical protein
MRLYIDKYVSVDTVWRQPLDIEWGQYPMRDK